MRSACLVGLTVLLVSAGARAQSASSSPPPTASASPTASPSPTPAEASGAPPSSPAPASSAPPSSEEPAPEPIAPGEGRLRVAVNRPDTDVFVDGIRAGVAPFERDYPPGDHTVRLECAGYKSWEGSVEIADGMLTPVRALLRPRLSRSNGVAMLVVATLFIGGGITMGVLSEQDRSALEAARNAGTLDNHDGRIARGEAFAIIADAGFFAAAAVATAGIYMVAHDPTSPSIARVGRPRPLTGGSR